MALSPLSARVRERGKRLESGLEAIVKEVREYAREHYNDEDSNWDILEETYTDEELTELILDQSLIHTTDNIPDLIRQVGEVLDLVGEVQFQRFY